MKKILVILAMLVAMNANAQWVQMSNGMGNDKSIASLAAFNNNIFAGTWDNGVYISTNNGLNWSQTSLNNQSVFSLATLGNNIFAGTITNGLYLSTNNGTNWNQSGFLNKKVGCLTSSGNNIFAGVSDNINPLGVYISTDFGANWSQTTLTNQYVYSLTTLGNNIFAGTWNGVYITTNNGINWNQTSLSTGYIYSLATVGSSIFAGAEYSTYGYGGVYFTTNNGINWTRTSLNNQTVFSLATYGNNVFAGRGFDGIYQTANNGINWLAINQGFSSVPTVRALLILNNYVFAGTVSYSVWRRPLSEIIGIQNISTETPSKYSLSQNYPNPFNPTTNIKFLIVNSGDVKLVVYDIQGREVRTLVNERLQPGTYEAAFDGSMLNSGVYFYKLIIRHGGSSTNTFSETKKMLLLK